MSAAATIKSALATKLATVSGIEASSVHTRRRRPGPGGFTVSDWQTLMEQSNAANAWTIVQEGFRSQWAATGKAWDLDHTFVIRGVYAHDDATNTEATFADLVEDVVDAINADQTLGTAVVRSHGTVQQRQYGYVDVANEPMHFVELELACRYTREP